MQTITKARIVKFLGALIAAMGLTVFFMGNSIEKDLMELGKGKLNETILK